jgi:hypothetical protein
MGRGRLTMTRGRPALTGTWANRLEGTHGAFACRLEEEGPGLKPPPAGPPALPPARCAGLWLGEARPAAEFAADVPVGAARGPGRGLGRRGGCLRRGRRLQGGLSGQRLG